MIVEIQKAKGPLKGEVIPPPDKSISHRAIIFSGIAEGKSVIRNFLRARDPMSTLKAMKALGVEITDNTSEIVVHGKGLMGLREPSDVIDCENSGTTMRMLTGLLAAQPFFSVLTGDNSLRQRPMARVIRPLRQMGAEVFGRKGNSLAPLAIKGEVLKGITYESPHASAQVKSAVLLAGLYATGRTTFIEPYKSRDHTERMLSAMGAPVEVNGNEVSIEQSRALSPIEITIPGDFSSSAFFICASLMVPGSEVVIKNVLINPTRTGLLNILKRMGAEIKLENQKEVSGEPVADLVCKYSPSLKATKVSPEEVPSMIDEFPIFAVLATCAEGDTVITGASELRVKESDRIATMTRTLSQMGASVEELPDGMIIHGPSKLKGAKVNSFGDHRV
ncbi:MAG: 3-phosphoshikimate 1-carboxyvinyltransferase, partial [Nitrospirae bacterium]